MESFEMRVGRPTGIDGIITKMVMVLFCPFLGRDRHNLFILAEKVNTLFPWPGIAHDEYLAEQENGVKVPALPAL